MPSPYGGGPYGKGLYSLSSVYDLAGGTAPVVTFAGDLGTLGVQDLGGVLAPQITFTGDIVGVAEFVGGLTQQVAFAGSLGLTISLAGGMVLQVVPAATIMGDKPVTGDIPILISLAADLTVGPFWEAPEPCPPIGWVPATCASSPVLETV
jgi:hypothetical protein